MMWDHRWGKDELCHKNSQKIFTGKEIFELEGKDQENSRHKINKKLCLGILKFNVITVECILGYTGK